MKRVEAPCPSCGAAVAFRVGASLVTVCAHCSSVVARGDRKLSDLGKTAALVETLSPLELGTCGTYQGKSFELVGHTQYRHATGAVWDEWYAALSNGRWGWLAEAQGRFWMTFRRKLKSGATVPVWDTLQAGQQIDFGTESRTAGERLERGKQVPDGKRGLQEPMTVAELGESQLIAAAGELPFRPEFHRPHRYADLSGADNRVGTLDYGEDPPAVFLGRSVALEELFVEVELGVAFLGGLSAPLLFLAFAYVTWFQLLLLLMVFAIGVLVGLELPLLMRILQQHLDFRELVSRVLAFDYIGALLASLLFPLLLVPRLGLVRTSLAFGILNALVGLWGTWLLLPSFRDRCAGYAGGPWPRSGCWRSGSGRPSG
jgi:hypothetical protein